MSIVFDRAVNYYDQTRAMPSDVEAAAIESLVREAGLARESRVLEIGIGTGRVALPLSTKIERVFGVDLSLGMMQVLKRKIENTGRSIIPTQADVVKLPFGKASFDAVYAVHLLHLVAGWEAAVDEARRVLKPGGHLLISWHRRVPDSVNTILRRELHRLVADFGVSTRRPGAQSEEEIRAELEKWGGEIRAVNVADWSEASTPAQILEELNRQIYSETWMIPREVMDQVMPQLRIWAEQKFGTLDREIVSPYNFRWLVVCKEL